VSIGGAWSSFGSSCTVVHNAPPGITVEALCVDADLQQQRQEPHDPRATGHPEAVHCTPGGYGGPWGGSTHFDCRHSRNNMGEREQYWKLGGGPTSMEDQASSRPVGHPCVDADLQQQRHRPDDPQPLGLPAATLSTSSGYEELWGGSTHLGRGHSRSDTGERERNWQHEEGPTAAEKHPSPGPGAPTADREQKNSVDRAVATGQPSHLVAAEHVAAGVTSTNNGARDQP